MPDVRDRGIKGSRRRDEGTKGRRDEATEGSTVGAIFLAAAALLVTGCHGSARVNLVMLGSEWISATAPLIVEVAPDECYYWLGNDGKLRLAMRRHHRSLLGRMFDYEFNGSFILEDPPAGAARNYQLDERTFRSRTKDGYANTRLLSRTGIIGVWDYGRGDLHGRFRFYARRHNYAILNGWGGERHVLVVGEFSAKCDRARGEAILQRSEEGDLKRPPPSPKPVPINGPPRSAQSEPSASGGSASGPGAQGSRDQGIEGSRKVETTKSEITPIVGAMRARSASMRHAIRAPSASAGSRIRAVRLRRISEREGAVRSSMVHDRR